MRNKLWLAWAIITVPLLSMFAFALLTVGEVSRIGAEDMPEDIRNAKCCAVMAFIGFLASTLAIAVTVVLLIWIPKRRRL